MDESITSLVFVSIRDEWQAIPPHLAPWGVWITQHPPLPADVHEILHPTRSVQQAWLLQGSEFPPQLRNVWEYIRFYTMHFERPWDPYFLAPRDPRFERTYPLGLAAFAPLADTRDLCLETTWGGRSGRGRRIRQTAPGVLSEIERFWIS